MQLNTELTKTNASDASEITEAVTSESILRKHKDAILTAAFIGAVALSMTEFDAVKNDIVQNAEWIGPAIGATEAVAWSGAGMMLVSTGNKLGNPFTVRKRLNAIKDKLSASTLYRAGSYTCLTGALGTSGLITAETFKDLPPSSWPLALGTAAVSTAMAVPFVKIARRGKNGAREL